MKRKNIKYKIFWAYDDGSKEFSKNASLSEMSACYKWDNGIYGRVIMPITVKI